MLGDVVPALRREGIGAEHETVGKFEEGLAPFGIDLASGSLVGAKGEIAPEVLVLAQHLAHALGPVEPRMRPQDPRLRPLLEQALDRFDIGMRVQEKAVLPRELDHAARDR